MKIIAFSSHLQFVLDHMFNINLGVFSTVADTISRFFGVQHCRGYSALQKCSMSRGYNYVFEDTMRRLSTAEEYFQYYGAEYHQNIGGSSVLWRIRSVYRRVFSTGDIGDTINTLVGYPITTVLDIQY